MQQLPILARAVFRQAAGALLFALLAAGPALAGNGTITGTVKDAGGAALAGAFVTAYDANNNIYPVTAGDDGTYSIEAPAGTYTITALAIGHDLATLTGVTLAADKTLDKQDLQLKAATPFAIRKAAAPIPLTAGIDSPSFADAPDIRIDQPYQVVVGLSNPNDWPGPKALSGRFRVKYDATALYIAGDVTWAHPHVNSHTDGNVWQGDAIEFYIQNDPFDPNRTAYDNDHNWQLILGDGPTPAWWLFGGVQAKPKATLAENFQETDKANNTGILFRLNVPWAILLKEDGNPISAPADEALGAFGIAINSVDINSDVADSVRQFQMMWPMSNSNWTNPSGLQPIVFTAKTP
jgi:Carboxypeptidase regulatory-like domain/Carbohydrate family 9 binding domain-like